MTVDDVRDLGREGRKGRREGEGRRGGREGEQEGRGREEGRERGRAGWKAEGRNGGEYGLAQEQLVSPWRPKRFTQTKCKYPFHTSGLRSTIVTLPHSTHTTHTTHTHLLARELAEYRGQVACITSQTRLYSLLHRGWDTAWNSWHQFLHGWKCHILWIHVTN